MGITPAHDCDNEGRYHKKDPNLQLSWRSKGWFANKYKEQGSVALGMPIFSQLKNRYPVKFWIDNHFPPALLGMMTVKDSVFAYFKKTCGNEVANAAFSTIVAHLNAHGPVELRGIKTHEVEQGGKIAIQHPYTE